MREKIAEGYSEAWCGRQAGWQQRSPKVIRDASGRAGRHEGIDSCTLPGEASPVRAGEESAEAIVAEKRGNARGAKGLRNKTELGEGLKGSCEGI